MPQFKQYLAIMINSNSENNITFSANNFKEASKHLKTQVKNGTMFQHIKLLELDTMISKTYYF
jgi:hypothetical protein